MNADLMDYDTMYELMYKLDHLGMAKDMLHYGYSIGKEAVSTNSCYDFYDYACQIATRHRFFYLEGDEESYGAFWFVFPTPNEALMSHIERHFSYEQVFIDRQDYTDPKTEIPYPSIYLNYEDCMSFRSLLQCLLEAMATYERMSSSKEGLNP